MEFRPLVLSTLLLPSWQIICCCAARNISLPQRVSVVVSNTWKWIGNAESQALELLNQDVRVSKSSGDPYTHWSLRCPCPRSQPWARPFWTLPLTTHSFPFLTSSALGLFHDPSWPSPFIVLHWWEVHGVTLPLVLNRGKQTIFKIICVSCCCIDTLKNKQTNL